MIFPRVSSKAIWSGEVVFLIEMSERQKLRLMKNFPAKPVYLANKARLACFGFALIQNSI